MKFMETRRYEMLVRVRDFGAANGDRFPASTLAGKTFAAVSSTVNDLAGLAGTRGDREAAARYLGEALRRFGDLGLPHYAERAETLAASLGVALPPLAVQ